ncbi:MAG: type II toxin-antitoxin system PemK/MazF family toxin [Clostridia bacterium]
MKRGEIYLVDLDPVIGSEQGGIRPVLIVQNNIGNEHSTTLIVAPITSKLKALPTHVDVSKALDVPSHIQLEQLRTVDKKRVLKYIATLRNEQMKKVDKAFKTSLNLW